MELSSLVLRKHESRRRPGIAKVRETAPPQLLCFHLRRSLTQIVIPPGPLLSFRNDNDRQISMTRQ